MSALLAVQLADEPAAACFVDGALRVAVRECVLRRVALAGGFPSAAVDAVLEAAGLAGVDIDEIVVVGLVAGGPLGKVRGLAARLRARSAPLDTTARVRRGAEAATAVDRAGLTRALASAGLGHGRLSVVDAAAAARACPASLPPAGAALAVGAALAHRPGLRLPPTPLWAPGFDDLAAYRALSNGALPRERVEDPVAAANGALQSGRSVVWARGPAAFLDSPLGPRVFLVAGPESLPADWRGPAFPGARAELLRAPDGIAAHSPTDVVRAFRGLRADVLVLGDYVVER